MDPEQRREILEKLAAGQMTAVEAADLLNLGADADESEATETVPPRAEKPAPEKPPAEKMPAPQPAAAPGKRPNRLRIQIQDADTGRHKVTVNLPVRMLRLGLKIGSRFAPELSGLHWDEIDDLLQNAEPGVLVEVEDHEGGEQVKIFFE